MDGRVKLELTLEGPTMTADIGWPRFRALMDAYIRAVATMAPDVAPDDIMPTTIEQGSLRAVLEMSPQARRASDRLNRGPNRRWTSTQIQAAEKLYECLRDNDVQALTTRYHRGTKARPLIIPRRTADGWELIQREHMRVNVFRAGGRDGIVELVSTRDGRFRASCAPTMGEPKAVAARFAKHLYQDVTISGTAHRHGRTGELLSFDVDTLDQAPAPTSTSDFFDRVADILGEDTVIDVDATLEAIR